MSETSMASSRSKKSAMCCIREVLTDAVVMRWRSHLNRLAVVIVESNELDADYMMKTTKEKIKNINTKLCALDLQIDLCDYRWPAVTFFKSSEMLEIKINCTLNVTSRGTGQMKEST